MYTMFNAWGYPEYKEEPYFSSIQSFFGKIDLDVFYLKLVSTSLLLGGGTLGWNGSTGLLTWTSKFVIPIVTSGFVVEVASGPDHVNKAITISSGGFAYVELPTVITANVSKYMASTTKWTGTGVPFVVAYNYGNVCYMRNGQVLT